MLRIDITSSVPDMKNPDIIITQKSMLERSDYNGDSNIYAYVDVFMHLLLAAGFDPEVITNAFNEMAGGSSTFDEIQNAISNSTHGDI